jgi:hypothetical protein
VALEEHLGQGHLLAPIHRASVSLQWLSRCCFTSFAILGRPVEQAGQGQRHKLRLGGGALRMRSSPLNASLAFIKKKSLPGFAEFDWCVEIEA